MSTNNIFFMENHKDVSCVYSLESPRWGDSNEYTEVILMSTHNICFYGEISKIIP